MAGTLNTRGEGRAGVEGRRRRAALAEEGRRATSSFFCSLAAQAVPTACGICVADRRADRHEVQLPHRVVHRHLPPLDRVLGVAEQLAHERAQRVAAVERRADLAVGRVEPVARAQRVRGADVRRLLAQRDR